MEGIGNKRKAAGSYASDKLDGSDHEVEQQRCEQPQT